MPLGETRQFGPFEVELVTLTHSIPEPNGLAIRTPLGLILHTGDWKIDPDPLIGEDFDQAKIAQLGREGVLAMVCDSTNVFVEGEAGSEGSAREALKAGRRGTDGTRRGHRLRFQRRARAVRLRSGAGERPVRLPGRPLDAPHRRGGADRSAC